MCFASEAVGGLGDAMVDWWVVGGSEVMMLVDVFVSRWLSHSIGGCWIHRNSRFVVRTMVDEVFSMMM